MFQFKLLFFRARYTMTDVSVITVSSSTTVDVGYDMYFIDCTSNNVELTIPDTTTWLSGHYGMFKRIDSAVLKTCTIVLASGNNIDISSSVSILPNGKVNICSDENNAFWTVD